MKNNYDEIFTVGILQSRTELEQQSIETSNTAEAVSFITYVQSLKRKMKNWEKEVEVSTKLVFQNSVKVCNDAFLSGLFHL